MNKHSKAFLVAEALITVQPVLALKRAFKKPPAVPSATLRPVIELSPGFRSFTTPEQIQIACQAWFANAAERAEKEEAGYQAGLADTVPAKAPLDAPAHLDLGGWWGV